MRMTTFKRQSVITNKCFLFSDDRCLSESAFERKECTSSLLFHCNRYFLLRTGNVAWVFKRCKL